MAVVIHTINGSQYAYNHHREGKKVVCDYIGKAGGSEGDGDSAPVHVAEEVTQRTNKEDVFVLNKYDVMNISKMSEEDFKNNIPSGFVFHEGYGEEASLLPNGKIALTPKFFTLSDIERIHTLQHEEGHRWEGQILTRENHWVILDSGIFGDHTKGIFTSSTKNISEPIAEARAYYILQPEELKNIHPAAYHFINEIEKGEKWESALKTAKQYPYTTRKENYELSFKEYDTRYKGEGVSYTDHKGEIVDAIRKGKPVSEATRNLYDLSGYDLTPKEK